MFPRQEKYFVASLSGAGRTLEVVPEALHQRTPVILGSTLEVEHVAERLR